MLDMTDQQLNRALAELMGGKVVQTHDAKEGGGAPLYQLVAPGFKGRFERKPEDAWIWYPDFCIDPATSLEVQARALMTAGKEYTKCLTKILTDSFEIEVPENDPYWIATLVLTATPRQRAEASYMTLSSQN
ncbi:hypothetical protein DXC69_03860 [Paenibacillus polymyxa]|nr:hypothetical protein DXC69_03860 [Paenibacillus polymyxa]